VTTMTKMQRCLVEPNPAVAIAPDLFWSLTGQAANSRPIWPTSSFHAATR
jgi:hypothetical protein